MATIIKKSFVTVQEFREYGIPNLPTDITDTEIENWLLQACRDINEGVNQLIERLDIMNDPEDKYPERLKWKIKEAVIQLTNYWMGGDYQGDEIKRASTFSNGVASFQTEANTYDSYAQAFPSQVRKMIQNSGIMGFEDGEDPSIYIDPDAYLKKKDFNTDNVINKSNVEGDNSTEALNWLKDNAGKVENFADLVNDTDVPASDGKEVINSLYSKVNVNTGKTTQNELDIATNDTNIDINTNSISDIKDKLVNIDTDGTVLDTTYDPDTNPNAFATQNMVKSNTSKEWDYDAQGNKIINVGAPQNDTDASTKKYVDDQLRPATGKQSIKETHEVEAELTGSYSLTAMARNGTILNHTQNSVKVDTFEKDGITYNTDAIKIKLHNIISYIYPSNTTDNIIEYTYPIGEIGDTTNGGNKDFKSFNVKFKSGTGNFYYGRQGFNIYRNGSGELVLQTVGYTTSGSEKTHIKSMDFEYTQIKYKGAVGIKGDTGNPGADGIGIKGDKGDTGNPGADGIGIKGDKGEKGDKGDTGVIPPELDKRIDYSNPDRITIYPIDKNGSPQPHLFISNSLYMRFINQDGGLTFGVGHDYAYAKKFRILTEPIADSDAATKKYVDDNSGSNPELDKRIDYGTNERTILTTDKTNSYAPIILLDNNANKVSTTLSNRLVSEVFQNRILFYQNLNMLGNDIENISTIGSTDAMTISSADDVSITSGNTLYLRSTNTIQINKDINMSFGGASKIKGLADPTETNDAANKIYVDKPRIFPRQTFESDTTLADRDNVHQVITGFIESRPDIKTSNMFSKVGNKFNPTQELLDIIAKTDDGVNVKFIMKCSGFVGVAQPQYLTINKYRSGVVIATDNFAAVWQTSSSANYVGAINQIPYEVVIHFEKSTLITDGIEFTAISKDFGKAYFQAPFTLSIEGEWV